MVLDAPYGLHALLSNLACRSLPSRRLSTEGNSDALLFMSRSYPDLGIEICEIVTNVEEIVLLKGDGPKSWSS